MIKKGFTILCLLCLPFALMAQEERHLNRKGVDAYEDKEYKDAILDWQKAIKANPDTPALYENLGHGHYRNENYEEAVKNYMKPSEAGAMNSADQFYNLGNALLQSGEYDKSIEAYKQALRSKPDHYNSKYNMSLARAIKKRMQQQQKQQQQQQDKDKNQDKDKEQQQKQQQQQQNKDQKEQQQQQQQKQKLSKEDAERILNALEKKDQELQEEKKKKLQEAQPYEPDKDW
jgi:tetratricopeptide (TPR) repeat protein